MLTFKVSPTFVINYTCSLFVHAHKRKTHHPSKDLYHQDLLPKACFDDTFNILCFRVKIYMRPGPVEGVHR